LLREKVYEPKKARTLNLVQQAVWLLQEEGQRVSLVAISRKTKEIDPDGRGVSESAVLTNPDAYAHYKQHGTQLPRPKRRTPTSAATPHVLRPVRLNRDTIRVRQRYLRLPKVELTDRLIALEQAYRELHDRWLDAQDELLDLKLPKPPAH
jgi:hypothetical protein